MIVPTDTFPLYIPLRLCDVLDAKASVFWSCLKTQSGMVLSPPDFADAVFVAESMDLRDPGYERYVKWKQLLEQEAELLRGEGRSTFK